MHILAFLFLLLVTSPAFAQAPCADLPARCEDGRLSCTFERTCINANDKDADGNDASCIYSQTIYVQDCTPQPRPRYCSDQPSFALRTRKQTCEKKP